MVDTFGTNKEDEVLVVETEDGCNLQITHMHPVLTTDGLVPARDLTPDDELVTANGKSRIASIKPQQYSGMVYGFSVGATPEEESQLTPDNTCYYANGILIADNRVCVEFLKTYKKRLSTVLARIPAEFHPEAKRAYQQRYGQKA